MTTRSAERTEFLSDIIIGAVEGGTGYWAQVSAYQYVMDGEVTVYTGKREGDLTRAVLHELNDDETGYKDEALVLDIDAVARALGKIKRGEVTLNSTLKGYILTADSENDAGDIDSDCADVIAQIALLGDLVYG